MRGARPGGRWATDPAPAPAPRPTRPTAHLVQRRGVALLPLDRQAQPLHLVGHHVITLQAASGRRGRLGHRRCNGGDGRDGRDRRGILVTRDAQGGGARGRRRHSSIGLSLQGQLVHPSGRRECVVGTRRRERGLIAMGTGEGAWGAVPLARRPAARAALGAVRSCQRAPSCGACQAWRPRLTAVWWSRSAASSPAAP